MKKIFLLAAGAILLTVLSTALFVTSRQVWAAREAAREWQAARVTELKDIGSTNRLEILPLYEEAGDPGRYQIGHGLSYLITTDTTTFLMDVGNHPAEAARMPLDWNMRVMSISWDAIDAVIFSHFHPDHVGGVAAWKAGEVYLGSGMFDQGGKPVYTPSAFAVPGAVPTLLADPTVLGPGVATLGTITYLEGIS